MSNENRYLTKSRFILALECPTKLYYTRKPDKYPDQKKADSFLFELAKGGMQVGELAKFYFTDDPASILVQSEPHEYDKALQETQERLNSKGRVVIAEGAFLYKDCYVRADIIIKTESGDLELYEIKSKSYREEEDVFINKGKISSKWSPYLHDVAFQKWVIANATGRKVKAYISVVNKEVYTSVAGLAKHFIVSKDANDRVTVATTPGLSRNNLGNELLKSINIDDVCNLIYEQPLKLSRDEVYSFEAGIKFLSESYKMDSKILSKPIQKCGKCEFYASTEQKDAGLQSGRKECWVNNGWVTEKSFNEDDLVFELWGGNAGGGKSPTQKLIDSKKYLLKDAKREDFDNNPKPSDDGLSSHDRREQQIIKSRSRDFSPYLDKDGLKKVFATFKYPLHFIDFETTATALPWFIGMRPFQGIAFQFSHHVIQSNGRIEHKDQFLSFEPGVFPNFDFIRNLKLSLESDEGTIFRYHIHENSYLNFIYDQLDQVKDIPDKTELQKFIRSITEWNEYSGDKKIDKEGSRNMVDLYKIVLSYYYSLHAKGSNSLKQILPSAIKSFPFLLEKYSKPVYGSNSEITSLNFSEERVWVTEACQYDPYKTLEPVFKGFSPDELDKLVEDTDVIADGGSAMMAYNMLQYSGIPLEQRNQIKEALLKYCELDTLAMVMLYEGLKSSIQ